MKTPTCATCKEPITGTECISIVLNRRIEWNHLPRPGEPLIDSSGPNKEIALHHKHCYKKQRNA